MRSRSRIAAWVVGLAATAVAATLGCGGGGEESGLQLNAVTYANGLFITVGESDQAYANPGTGWTPFPTGVPSLQDVTYFARSGLFVAVGGGGAIVTSTDGVAWAQQNVPTSFNLNGVAAGDALVIAVGDGGTILSSADGATWVARNSGTDATLSGVTVGGGLVVAVGVAGTVVVSDDAGLTWDPTFSGLTNDLNAVAYGVVSGVGTWVAVGQDGIILRGETPLSWEVEGDNVLPTFNDVIFTQGLFIVVGNEGNILTSADGESYAASVSNTGQFLYGAAFGDAPAFANGTFYVVGSGGRALTSRDGAIYQNGKI